MSSHPKGERISQDAYLTPPELTRAMLSLAGDLRRYESICDPSAGEGAFIKAARDLRYKKKLIAIDIRPECRVPCEKAGATTFRCWDFLDTETHTHELDLDLIVANPPFSGLVPHVTRYLELLRDRKASRVMVLARVGFLATKRRTSFWREWWPLFDSFTPLVQRPSFTFGGTDSSEYGIFQFSRTASFAVVRPPLDWKGESHEG